MNADQRIFGWQTTGEPPAPRPRNNPLRMPSRPTHDVAWAARPCPPNTISPLRSSVVFILAALALLCTGCATRVIPPADLRDPVTVYVADYGRHSSIILPTGGANLIEYAYGDWELYANNKYRWYSGWTKLILTEEGALGRRAIEFISPEQWLRMRIWAKRLIKIQVEREKAAALLDELEKTYDDRIDTQIYNGAQATCFVKNHSRYWLMHNCNQMTAEWLRKLGCDVQGAAVLSNFKVEPPGRTIVEEPAPAGPQP